MNTLFPVGPVFPPGFSYFPDFIDRKEEQLLQDAISKEELHTFIFQGHEARRRVLSFGYDYSFDRRTLTKGKDIPSPFRSVIQKVALHTGIQEEAFAEMLLTEYPVGSVINWHRDAPPFDVIAGISLASDCGFKLRPHEKSKQRRNTVISFPVHRRSLYLIADEARSAWQHSIAPVKAVRYSITLRTLRNASLLFSALLISGI